MSYEDYVDTETNIDISALLQLLCNNATNSSLDACIDNLTSASSESTESPQNIVGDYVVPAFFCFLLLFGLPCNGLVTYIVLRHGILRTVTNLLLFNLAFADLLFLCFCLPMFAASYIMRTWPFGLILCKLFYYHWFIKSPFKKDMFIMTCVGCLLFSDNNEHSHECSCIVYQIIREFMHYKTLM